MFIGVKMQLFPFSDYWPFYVSFIGFVLLILAFDLGLFHKKAHEISFKEAGLWTTVWVSLAIIFGFSFYHFAFSQFSTNGHLLAPGVTAAQQARASALEFFTGYVVELSLSVDNLFIFTVIFSYFNVPKIHQHRILFWGIIGALLFRGIFISLGSVLMQYEAVVIFFGVFLVFTGLKMFFTDNKKEDLNKNVVLRFLNKVIRVHKDSKNGKFFVRMNGMWYATPLFIALLFIEFTDVIFAVDSVPAIFALTKEPLIVLTSNMFAILGLRSLYFILLNVLTKFTYMKYGLAVVLVFVGLKMAYLNHAFDGKFPISWSLGIIVGCIGTSILASFVLDKSKKR